MSTDCVRRARSVWPTCPCDTCRTQRARTAKLNRAGRYHRPSADQAWAVIDRLLAQDWTASAIASGAGLPDRTIQGAIYERATTGHAKRFGRGVTLAVINHGQPARGSIGATGTMRRLQALAAIGWTLQDVADRTALPFSTLASIRSGVTTAVRVHIAQAIGAVYDQLCMTPGPSARSRAHAVKVGWVSALAWDDIDTDEHPDTGTPGGREMTPAELTEHVTRLTRAGLSAAQISDRLGIARRTVVRHRAKAVAA